MITWLYDIDKHGATIRVPIDLDTHAIDWLRFEPWQEPPLLSRVRMRCRVCHDERGCKHTRVKEVYINE